MEIIQLLDIMFEFCLADKVMLFHAAETIKIFGKAPARSKIEIPSGIMQVASSFSMVPRLRRHSGFSGDRRQAFSAAIIASSSDFSSRAAELNKAQTLADWPANEIAFLHVHRPLHNRCSQ